MILILWTLLELRVGWDSVHATWGTSISFYPLILKAAVFPFSLK